MDMCVSVGTRAVQDTADAEEKDTHDDIEQCFAFYIEWYVLDDNGGGYDLVLLTRQASHVGGARSHGRREHVAEWRRSSR